VCVSQLRPRSLTRVSMSPTAQGGVQLDGKLRSRVCAALAKFRGSDEADEAALVQLWLPKIDDDGLVLLQTKVSCGSMSYLQLMPCCRRAHTCRNAPFAI